MLSYHNNPKLKEQLEKQMELHTINDEIIQNKYWEKGKGCFIGCAAHSDDPQILEDVYGIPLVLSRIAECIFESLPSKDAKTFPLEIVRSIPVGVDLDYIWPEFAIWLLIDPEHGVARVNNNPAITNLAKLYQQYGNNIPIEAAKDIRASADIDARTGTAAAASACTTAGKAATAASADNAATAAAHAAAAATHAAAAAAYVATDAAAYVATDAAAFTAIDAARKAQRTKFIQLLSKYASPTIQEQHNATTSIQHTTVDAAEECAH